VLTIAGSDSGGSAGIQADLKTFAAHSVFGMSALTVVTAQNTVGVQAAHPIPVDFIESQIQAVMSDIGADGIKTGFLGRAPVVDCVARLARDWSTNQSLIVDPVLLNGMGQQIVTNETVAAYRDKLFPQATLITPNLDEAALLAGLGQIENEAAMREAAFLIHDRIASNSLSDRHRPGAVLIKGLVVNGGGVICNLLYDGDNFHEFRQPRLPIQNPHGVGCTLSAAIVANLARQSALMEAVQRAFNYLHAALAGALDWQLGQGRLPVNHHHKLPPTE
jgi:hydroxymethylpyrimidine/phosphomethylpyrimidine kinase